jgi:hypothetical protein
MVEANIKIISTLKSFLQLSSSDLELKRCFIEKPTDFTRQRKLTYQRTVFLLINMLKRSIAVELEDFFETCISDATSCTKAAFTLQRKKLKPLFFTIWNDLLVLCFYDYYGDAVKKWNNFILIAVDGSTSHLMNKDSVKSHFGTHGNHFVEVPMAGVMKFYDVLNKITIFSKIYPIAIGEKTIVAENIEKFPANSLSIYDRGFPSFSLMYLLINQESTRHFVMRCKQCFNREVSDFMQSSENDLTIELLPNNRAIHKMKEYGFVVFKKTSIRVRMVKVVLSTGEIEVLLTNLYDNEIYTRSCFKELYFMRWGIETSYGHDKNVLQMEQFSGHTVCSIEQDFYASIFVSNLQAIIEKQCDAFVETKNKERKLEYKINKSVSTGYMKHKIVLLFMYDDTKIILLKLQKLFEKNLEPVRSERNYPRRRSKTKSNGKYRTLTNYKRVL